MPFAISLRLFNGSLKKPVPNDQGTQSSGVDQSCSVRSLEEGDAGAVVHVYKDEEGYEVEFITLDGRTAAVATLESSQVRPVNARDITHTRELTTA